MSIIQAGDPIDKKPCVSGKLQTTLHRIAKEIDQTTAASIGPELSSQSPNGSIENLFNLSEKLVAVESL